MFIALHPLDGWLSEIHTTLFSIGVNSFIMTNKHKLRTNPSRLADAVQRVTRTASWRADKESSTARGYTYEWQQARLEWLQQHPLCVMCQRAGRVTAATVVDHIKPHRGDMVLFWNRDNWQSLCATCHSARKQRMERAQRR
jgi:5-methylcytosine-specific restriction protein A